MPTEASEGHCGIQAYLCVEAIRSVRSVAAVEADREVPHEAQQHSAPAKGPTECCARQRSAARSLQGGARKAEAIDSRRRMASAGGGWEGKAPFPEVLAPHE